MFNEDLVFVYGMLTSVFREHGEEYVADYRHNQDGLLLWMRFLDIYDNNGDKATLTRKYEKIISQNMGTYSGLLVDFINEQERAYSALAKLGTNYSDDERVKSINGRVAEDYHTYGDIVSRVEDKGLNYMEAI